MIPADTHLGPMWGKPFIPEKLTPLRLTASWSKLSAEERLRYNQLQGLYFHEQIIFFEQRMIVPLIAAARQLVTDSSQRDALSVFIEEENSHSAQFHALLRELRPEWYERDWRHFVEVGGIASAVLAGMVRCPRQFPFLLWLVQLLEERTMYASRLYLAEADAFPAKIVAAQRQHLMDEADHVQWDIQLLNDLWPRTPEWLRRLNVRLLDWMVAEFIAAPRRAAIRVVDALGEEMPHLSVPVSTIRAELRTLATQPDFQRGVFGRDAVPRTWKQAAAARSFGPFVSRWFVHEHTH